jgi:hypothetical protein
MVRRNKGVACVSILADAMIAGFRVLDLEIAGWEATHREAGLQFSSRVVNGEHGPEFQMTLEGVTLRVWATPVGPGCRTKGASVLGFVWARIEPVSGDRPIGVLCLSGASPTWRALPKGDLPSAGTLTIVPSKMRHGIKRVAELLRSELKPAVWERWQARVSQEGGD